MREGYDDIMQYVEFRNIYAEAIKNSMIPIFKPCDFCFTQCSACQRLLTILNLNRE